MDVSASQLRGEGADKAIARACRVDGRHGAAGDHGCLAADQREHAALAERHGDDSVRPGWQRPRRFNEPGRVVRGLEFGVCEKPQLGLIQDQDIDKIEQLRAEHDRRCGIEDRGRTSRPRALEKCSDGGQRDLELADRDVALGQQGCGDILWRHQRIGAGHHHDGVVGTGDGDDGRSGMGSGGVLDEGEVDTLRGQKRPQLLSERIRAEPADQRCRCAQLRGGHRLVRAFAAGKIVHGIAGDGFADLGMPAGCRHHIHVDAAGDEDASHIVSQGLPNPKILSYARFETPV